jgi:hypothetical protein
MKARILILTVAVAGAAFAQRYGGGLVGGLAPQPYGSVGGYGSVLFPGTGHPPLASFGGFHSGGHYGGGYYGGGNYGYGHRRYPAVAAYPVFVGGYGYGYGLMDDPPQVQQQQPPQTIVVQQPPPAQAAPTPSVVINQYFRSDGPAGAPEPQAMYGPPGSAAPAAARSDDKPTIYLIAMKDHTIMPALGYWIEGDTLTYITSQGNKNSVSLTLVDRDFSKQLNDERHIEFNL